MAGRPGTQRITGDWTEHGTLTCSPIWTAYSGLVEAHFLFLTRTSTLYCQGRETKNFILGLKIMPWRERYTEIWKS